MLISDTKIEIRGLRVFARHGVLPEERVIGNEFELSLTLTYDATSAIESDDIDDALNYASVIELVQEEMSEPSDLLEHVAGRIANAVNDNFPQVESGTLTIVKLHPPVSAQLAGTAFTMSWHR